MKKYLSILLALVLILSMAACGDSNTGNAPAENPPEQSKPEEPQPQEPSFEKILRFISTTATTSANPFNNNGDVTDWIQGKLYQWSGEDREGLAQTASIIIPEMAAKEPYTKDGDPYTWYIELRNDLQWANGEKITADDYMFTWKTALDPKIMATYSSTANIAKNIIEIENAVAYYKQAAADTDVKWEDVGFKKIDDYTITLKCTQKYTSQEVMKHFQNRYCNLIYRPLWEANLSADGTSSDYGTSADKIMSCGAFVIDSWTPGAEVKYKKNPLFCGADRIKLDGAYCRVVTDDNTALELFQSGQIDYLALGTSSFEVYSEDPRTDKSHQGFVRSIQININNPDKPYLANVNFRRALYYATNRDMAAQLSHWTPAPYFLSLCYSMSTDGTPFRELPESKAYIPANNGYDPDLAREYFNKAMEETGWNGKVSLNLYYAEGTSGLKLISEYLINSWQEVFGADKFELTVTAAQQSAYSSLLRESKNAEGTNKWDLAWLSWNLGAAKISANNKFERYTSWTGTGFTKYANDVVDELYPQSITDEIRLDQEKLIAMTQEMEKSVIENVTELDVCEQVTYTIFSDRCIRPFKTCLLYNSYDYMRFDLAYGTE